MPRASRSTLLLSTALAAMGLSLGTTAALADDAAGFAIELAPSSDYYVPMRVGVQAFGPAVEPAASYVRGCQGHVVAEGAGVAFEVIEQLETLSFTAAGDGLVSMVLGTPDGLYRCALVGDDGLAATQLAGVQTGRYLVWLGGEEGSRIDARLFASDRPISALELFGLDVDALGAPREGTHVFTATAETGRQDLVMGGQLHADVSMNALNTEYCPGYGRFDAADAVLTLDSSERMLSIFAMSERDLTIAVRGPDGTVLCNDDSFGLNPAVSFNNAQAGDYQIFVGGFSQGGRASYDLFASQGAPAFTDATLDLSAEPRGGYSTLDVSGAEGGMLLTSGPIVANDPFEMLPIGNYCPGYTGIDAADLVLSVDEAQPMLSFYAMSQTDLVMAVRGPDGQWLCNDDTFGLNPAVEFHNAAAGDYHVFVGAYSRGASGEFNLYTALGQPNWDGAQASAGSSQLDPAAEPAVGRVSFGPQTRVDPRVIFDVLPSSFEAFGLGSECAGFIVPERPDLVIDAEAGLPQLMVYMVSEADGTLLVVDPDGQIHCNDDFEGLHPGVMIPNPQPGDYAVFAGTYGGNGGVATLGATIANPLWVMDREH
ncbi:MAG: hypothetical protein JJU15_06975 [Pararhodobacter sp.]|nr:hypothetical protein [Pararhodobacter sp.]